MEVILIENVQKLGKKFETIDVKKGYALNYLIPQGLARTATNSTLKSLQKQREIHKQKREEKEKELAQKLSTLAGTALTLTRKANDQGHLFAGISPDDIVDALNDKEGIEVDPDYIILEHGIKEVGEHKVPIHIQDKSIELTLSVEAEE